MGHFNLIYVGEDYKERLDRYNFETRDPKYLTPLPYYRSFIYHSYSNALKRDKAPFKLTREATLHASSAKKHGIKGVYIVKYVQDELFDPRPNKKLWIYLGDKKKPEFFCRVLSVNSDDNTAVVMKIKPLQKGPIYRSLEEFKRIFFTYDEVLCEWVAPYKINPKGKFDWYEFGGRWTGFFKLKENPRFPEKIKTGTCLDENKIKPGYADQVCVCDVDWECMRRERVGRFKERYANFLLQYNNKKNPDELKVLFYVSNVRNKAKRKNKFIPETEEENVERSDILPVYAIFKDDEWEDVDSWFAKQENKMDQNNVSTTA